MNAELKLIKNNVGQLKLAEELGNVSLACKIMHGRDTYYQLKDMFDNGG